MIIYEYIVWIIVQLGDGNVLLIQQFVQPISKENIKAPDFVRRIHHSLTKDQYYRKCFHVGDVSLNY